MAARWVSLLPALASFVGALIAFVAGSYHIDLACDRAKNQCSWTDGIFGADTITFPISDVREVKYVGGRGKHGGDGLVALVLPNGDELEFGKADDEEAKATTEQARAFFKGGTGATYEWHLSRRWLWIVAGAFTMSSLFVFVFTTKLQRR